MITIVKHQARIAKEMFDSDIQWIFRFSLNLQIVPLSKSQKWSTLPLLHQDEKTAEWKTDHRVERNNASSIFQKEVAECKDQPLHIAGRSARLFTEFTLEVPAIDGTAPVHTMAGRGREPLNWKTELCTLSNRLRTPLLAARTDLFYFF